MTQSKQHPIEVELSRLDEPAPSSTERALLGESSTVDLERLPEVAATSLLFELSEAASPTTSESELLSELALHRLWREVEGRLESGPEGRSGHLEHGAQPETSGASDTSGASGASDTSRDTSGPHPGRWRYALVALAAAAAVALIVVRGDDDAKLAQADQDHARQVSELGRQARDILRTLDDGQSESQRASSMASDYARRLKAEAG